MIGFFDNFAVMRVFSLLGLVALVTVLLQGCFQTHPYDTDFGGETDINRHHIIEIESACAAKSSVKVAVISDSHCWYSDLRDAVSDINAKGEDGNNCKHMAAVLFAMEDGTEQIFSIT